MSRPRAFRTVVALSFSAALLAAPRSVLADKSQAIVPIVAYNPTYKLIVGGAYFLFPSESNGEGASYGLQAMSTFTNNVKIIPEYKLVWGFLRFELAGRWTTYYDPYYGEGSETRVEDEVRLDEESGGATAGLYFQLGKVFSTGPVYDYRYRQNRGVDGESTRAIIPGENTGAYGWRLTLDGRDTAFSTKKGSYFSALFLSATENSTSHPRGFSLVTGDLRHFRTWGPITLALRGTGGTGSSSTSYLYRFRLGGTDLLRGYYTNRFRGSNFYLGQAEVRWEIIKPLSLVAFTDAGQVGDPIARGVEQTYGGGLRFGLPPDWVKKARLDIAFGKDQSGVSFVFDETF